MKPYLVHFFIGWNGKSYKDPNFQAFHYYALVIAKTPEEAETMAKEALKDYEESIAKASVVRTEGVQPLECDGWLVLWKYDDRGAPVLISDVGAFDNASYTKDGECGGV